MGRRKTKGFCLGWPRLSRSLIFTNRGRLSPRYVPGSLPHRERQLHFLSSLYGDALEHVEEDYLVVCQLVGSVGTGKTVTALSFGSILEREAKKRKIDLKHVYLNCKLDGSNRFVLYRSLLEKAAPEIATRSLSAEEMLHELLKHLRRENKYILVTLDEIGYFCMRSKEHAVYDLTRLNEVYPGRPSHVLGVMFIARDLSFHESLDPSERSTLGRLIVEFSRYTSEQIKDILDQRVAEAFKPGAMVEEVLDFISDVTVRPPINGDLRVALDLLLYSGNLAENQGLKRVLPDHVRTVYGETHPGITTEDVLNLDEAGKLVLLGIAHSLEGKRSPYVSLRDIREAYAVACEERGIKPVKDIEEYVEDLCMRGLVDMKSLTKFGISDVPAQKLREFLNGIMERVKHGLHENRPE